MPLCTLQTRAEEHRRWIIEDFKNGYSISDRSAKYGVPQLEIEEFIRQALLEGTKEAP